DAQHGHGQAPPGHPVAGRERGAEQDKAGGHCPHGQIVSATIGTWSWLPEIRSGANTLLSAVASQRPATATAAGSIRPVRWPRWASSVVRVTTAVAVMRSHPRLLRRRTPHHAPYMTLNASAMPSSVASTWWSDGIADTFIGPLRGPGGKGGAAREARPFRRSG